MTDHYYSSNPNAKSDKSIWNYTLLGHSFEFHSDAGVFSKKEVDFGSKLLIETFSVPQVEGDILDVGCGYGPIGLSIAKLCPKRKLYMVDVNERAVSLAKENALKNKVDNVEIIQSDLYELVESQQFAAILSNPPIRAGKKVTYTIYEESVDHLLPGGELWIVIQKKQGAPSVMKKLEQLFCDVSVVARKKRLFYHLCKKGLT
ncbi:class I SAM-dependent methyltransferase [Bacillus carboniphilus]|uniref:Class I SAM-dependent methyltransferase n=1 Tax=Bacillus carboniphilus TaxID=86663 RepID=A0ABY9JWC1_9BACI|nr:class I SAM-dependent methyltransferase [Bacillus carboniphilus]WLR41971.1 class I SAM-dependent methyltransferase [Bacillus carboniphilus]